MATKFKFYKVQEVASPEDLALLNEVLDQMVGKPCWGSNIILDWLKLDIGEKIPMTHPFQKGQFKGEWIFSVEGSGWEISCNSKTVVSSDEWNDDEEIPEDTRNRAKLIEGHLLEGYKVDYKTFDLDLEFSGGYKLMLYSGTDDEEREHFWELFTPFDMYLGAGPGESYFYTPSRALSMDPWEMLEFEDFLERARKEGKGGTLNSDCDFTMDELVAKSKEFRELYPYKSKFDEPEDQ